MMNGLDLFSGIGGFALREINWEGFALKHEFDPTIYPFGNYLNDFRAQPGPLADFVEAAKLAPDFPREVKSFDALMEWLEARDATPEMIRAGKILFVRYEIAVLRRAKARVVYREVNGFKKTMLERQKSRGGR